MLKEIAVALLMSVPAQPVPPPAAATITVAAVQGSGCSIGTTAVAISPDRAAFTLTYSSYAVSAGAGTAQPGDGRRFCDVRVLIDVPAKTAFAVSEVHHRGFAHLEAGASATLSSRYHFTGGGKPQFDTYPIVPDETEMWQRTDRIAAPKRVFSTCGKSRKLDIGTELRVTAARPTDDPSLITMDSTDSEVSTTYGLTWKAC